MPVPPSELTPIDSWGQISDEKVMQGEKVDNVIYVIDILKRSALCMPNVREVCLGL